MNNDRQALLDEARKLGLKFHPNTKTEKLQAMIDEAKKDEATDEVIVDEVIVDEAKQDEVTVDEPKQDGTVMVSVDVMKQLQTQMADMQKQIDANGVNTLPTNTQSPSYVDDLVAAINRTNTTPMPKGITVADTANRGDKIAKAKTLIRCTVIPRDPSKTSYKAEIITVSNDLVGDLKYKVPFNIVTHIPYFIYITLKGKKCNVYDEDQSSGNKATGEISGGSRSVDAYSIAVLPPLTDAEIKSLARKQRLRSENLDDREDAILGDEEEEAEEVTPKSELEALGYDV